jgi:aspartate/tyrosine/aromatic aminotransferase
MIVASSFAKNFGLYGERIGALHFVASTPEAVNAIASQLRVISRALYSTCPSYGARIVSLVLGDPGICLNIYVISSPNHLNYVKSAKPFGW